MVSRHLENSQEIFTNVIILTITIIIAQWKFENPLMKSVFDLDTDPLLE